MAFIAIVSANGYSVGYGPVYSQTGGAYGPIVNKASYGPVYRQAGFNYGPVFSSDSIGYGFGPIGFSDGFVTAL